jgi:F-type H+-transporting ATPase subunit b
VSLLEVFTTAQAWAAGGAEHHEPSISEVIFPALNFLIYAFIIVKFAFPAVRSFLRSRREEVIQVITQASAKKLQAEALVHDYKNKVAGLDKEVQSILASWREDAEREKAKLLTEAQSLAVKLKDDAQFLGEQEVKIARQKIRDEMANRAEVMARESVLRHLTPADQSRLAAEFIQDIGQTR